MESTLLSGDRVFVSKFIYGTQIPFFNNIHIPEFSNVHQNDIIIFNFPVDFANDSFNIKPWQKQLYIKRCIGLPGDSLFIIEDTIWVNKQKVEIPVTSQRRYELFPNDYAFSYKDINNLNIDDKIGQTELDRTRIIVNLTKLQIQSLATNPRIKSFRHVVDCEKNNFIFPNDSIYSWSLDCFGPIWIPKKNVTIQLNILNLPLYKSIIQYYEKNILSIKGNDIYINHKKITSYTFKMDYFFVLGDNFHSSNDSRKWGFVPIDHIIGKASFIAFSVGCKINGSKFIRWNRTFKKLQ